jgi:two-component system sensor histidine kinase/response regulator
MSQFPKSRLLASVRALPIVGVVPTPVVWDPAKALARLAGNEQLLHEIVQIFLEESSLQLADLKRAVTEADAGLLETTAHRLKGELSYLGMPNVSEKANKLEKMGHDRDLDHAAEVFSEFETQVSAVAENMRHMHGVKP